MSPRRFGLFTRTRSFSRAAAMRAAGCCAPAPTALALATEVYMTPARLWASPHGTRRYQEVQNSPNVASQEKLHKRIFKGTRNISDTL